MSGHLNIKKTIGLNFLYTNNLLQTIQYSPVYDVYSGCITQYTCTCIRIFLKMVKSTNKNKHL